MTVPLRKTFSRFCIRRDPFIPSKVVFASALQNSYSEKCSKSQRKITAMEFFSKKVADCYLT